MNPEDLRAEGNWLVQLKNILGVANNGLGNTGNNPQAQHRSTKTAVQELFTGLRQGAGQNPVGQQGVADIDKIIFNSVDQLISDKVTETDKHKTKQIAVARFKSEFARQIENLENQNLDPGWMAKIEETLQALTIEADREAEVDRLFKRLGKLKPTEPSALVLNNLFSQKVEECFNSATWQVDEEKIDAYRKTVHQKAADNNTPQLTEAFERKLGAIVSANNLVNQGDTLVGVDMRNALDLEVGKFPGLSRKDALDLIKMRLDDLQAKALANDVNNVGPSLAFSRRPGLELVQSTIGVLIKEEDHKTKVGQLVAEVDTNNVDDTNKKILAKAKQLGGPKASKLEGLQKLVGIFAQQAQSATLDELKDFLDDLIEDEEQRIENESEQFTEDAFNEFLEEFDGGSTSTEENSESEGSQTEGSQSEGSQEGDEQEEIDYDKIVSDSIDALFQKCETAGLGKSKLELLVQYGTELAAKTRQPGTLSKAAKEKIEAAIESKMTAEFNLWTGYQQAREGVAKLPTAMFARPDVRKALGRAEPLVSGTVISSLDPQAVGQIDFDQMFGQNAKTVVGESLKALARKEGVPGGNAQQVDRKQQLDPALFTLLKGKLSADEWNDPALGLGARVSQALWANQNYDQVCELIDHGVDGTKSTRATGKADKEAGRGDGYYSGFVQPIQHIVSKYLPDVAKLPQNEVAPPNGITDFGIKIRGAKKVLAKLAAYRDAHEDDDDWDDDRICVPTDWDEVKNSEMMVAFQQNPGTIWGFEDIRHPFVHAAHEQQGDDDKAQPLRMMELWKLVEQAIEKTLFEAMLGKKSAAAVDKAMEDAIGMLELRQFPGVKEKDWDKLIQKFETDAKAFLKEFIAQMPKVTSGHEGGDPSVFSTMSGVEASKLKGGIGCKAGLYWAKAQNQPVYYCLDGIAMEDVVNYKTMKTRNVQNYIDTGDKKLSPEEGKGHAETITMMEVREILKQWDKLKDTIVFTKKGKILTKNEAQQMVTLWFGQMDAKDKLAGRMPAPPRADFDKQLNDLDPQLKGRLQNTANKTTVEVDPETNKQKDWPKEADMDARDIVKKSGYLIKIAKTRRSIALRYIAERCEILVQYGLITRELVDKAIALNNIIDTGAQGESRARKELKNEIKRCNKQFRAPLSSALLRKEEDTRD